MHPSEVDVIVAGGGPAGCVVAGRLAFSDPNLKVMLIEAGPNNRDDPEVFLPGLFAKNYQMDGANQKTKFYQDAQPSQNLRGRKATIGFANVLGGGSSIEVPVYSRASASDWNDFKTEGWAAKDLLPLIKRMENYQKPTSRNDTHGYEGPIAISTGGQINPLAQDFLNASEHMGIPFSDDLQDLETGHGCEIKAKFIDRQNGRRSDAASAYVHSVMDVQNNLFLRTNCRVSRVIFEGNTAVGVAYVSSKDFSGAQPQETIVRARRCVVLSSGALGTPQILERSGVGCGEILKKLDMKVVSDLPGVGEQLQDHLTTMSLFRVSNESCTMDDFMRGDQEVQKELLQQWRNNPESAPLTSAIDAGFKLRPNQEQLKEMGPEFQHLWESCLKDKTDKPLLFGAVVSGALADHSHLPAGKYMSMLQSLQYPASRGKIHISSLNPHKEPMLDSGFLNNKADLAPMRLSYKLTREIARRMDSFRGELTSQHPHFCPGSPAACRDIDMVTAKQLMPHSHTLGVPMGHCCKPSEPFNPYKVHENVKYSEEDNKAIDEWIMDHVQTSGFKIGTCAMKSKDKGGVVDHRLNVYGTQNLKCIDMSICPENLGANTFSSSLVIGEKGAQTLCEDLGVKLKTPHAQVPHAHIPTGAPSTQQPRSQMQASSGRV
jgi:alcohol oxidase